MDDALRETLGFLQKLTLTPELVGPADVEALRAAGVDDRAVLDAVHVCALFSAIVRMADSLAFDVPPPDAFATRAPALLSGGYALRD